MASFSLRLLGTLQFERNGTPLNGFISDKVRALLIYLAVEAAQPQRRATLAALLWPDQPEAAARHNLRQALSNLRTVLGLRTGKSPLLHITRDTVQFLASDDTWIDCLAFDTLASQVLPLSTTAMLGPTQLEQLVQAATLMQGEFLAGFTLGNNAQFESWVQLRRERLYRQALDVFHSLGQAYTQLGNYTQAELYARRQLAWEPWREEAYRQLMHILVAQNQHAAALLQYDILSAVLAQELGVKPAAATTQLYQEILAAQRSHDTALRRAGKDAPVLPSPGRFYGRASELRTLQTWLLQGRAQLVVIVGIGGIGKTSLTIQLAREVGAQFDRLIWRSLLNAPPLGELLPDLLQVLAPSPDPPPPSLDAQLELLLRQLRQQRCLLMFDNLDALLQHGTRAGEFHPNYSGYAQLLTLVAEYQHQSCLLLTSRELPLNVTRLVREHRHVQVLELTGLSKTAGKKLLTTYKLHVSSLQSSVLINRYGGNPLALNLVAETIMRLYSGDIEAFLGEATAIFADIQDVLEQQFRRLSPLEQELMRWLAILREPVTLAQLDERLLDPIPHATMLEVLNSLLRRSLLQQYGSSFALHNVVMEYQTEQLITQVVNELLAAQPDLLRRHALVVTQAPQFIQQMQQRLLLQPIAHRLRARLEGEHIAPLAQRMFANLRAFDPVGGGYTAGNLLNLLITLDIDLSGFDCSQLRVWQADLRRANAARINLSNADLHGSAFIQALKSVLDIAWSPDGQIIAVAGIDQVIRIWRAHDARPLRILSGHQQFVWSIDFSPTDELLASGSHDGTVRLWDVTNGQLRTILRGNAGAVKAIRFSPDGRFLASGNGDGTIQLWEVVSGQLRQTLHGHRLRVSGLCFSPDGLQLASISDDQFGYVWDLASGALLHTLAGHTAFCLSIAWSPDGALIATSAGDQTVRIWHAPTGELIRALPAHKQLVTALHFSPRGQYLASAGNDGMVRVWDGASGQIIRSLPAGDAWAMSLRFSPDGEQLAVGTANDPVVQLWEVVSWRILQRIQGYVIRPLALAFSPDGQTLASSSSDHLLRLWDVAVGCVRQMAHAWGGMTCGVAFNPDGGLLAVSGKDEAVQVWSMPDARLVYALNGHTERPTVVGFSSDGRLLASGGMDHAICIWDMSMGQLSLTLHGHNDWVTGVGFSNDGQLLASMSGDGTLRFWSLPSGELLNTLSSHSSFTNGMITSADHHLLASVAADDTVCIWEFHTQQRRHVLCGNGGHALSASFSPDARLLAVGCVDASVRIWDVITGQLVATLGGHTTFVMAVAFSPNGRVLVSGDDWMLRVWDTQSWSCVETWHFDSPYAGMDITDATGLTDAQRAALRGLGAIERMLNVDNKVAKHTALEHDHIIR